MQIFFLVLLGGLVALPYLLFAARQPGGRYLIAAGLLVAALIYVGFAVFASAGSLWLAVEAGGVLLYGTFAWLGIRRSLWWLSLGWALHIAWDVGLHHSGQGAVFTPEWYPPACIGFDIAVAIAVIGLLASQKWVAVPRRESQ